MTIQEPATRPANPRFSSGPCAKPPGFDVAKLSDAPLGRSHRAAVGKAKLKAAIEDTRDILGIPTDYLIGIVPASGSAAAGYLGRSGTVAVMEDLVSNVIGKIEFQSGRGILKRLVQVHHVGCIKK